MAKSKAKKVVADTLNEVELANGNFINVEMTKGGYRVVVTDAGGNILKCLDGRDGLWATNVAMLNKILDAAGAKPVKNDDELILRIVKDFAGCTMRTLESTYFGKKEHLLEKITDLYSAVDDLVDRNMLIRVEWKVQGSNTVYSLLLPHGSDIQVIDWDIYFGPR